MNRPSDGRYVSELPSGIIKNPDFPIAGADLFVNDVVYLDGDMVFPAYDNTCDFFGVVAAKGIKGHHVLVAKG